MTTLFTAFSCLLLVAVLVSNIAKRTILSTAAIFLTAGFLLGEGMLGVITVEDQVIGHLAELTLFAVLFTDGMRIGLTELRQVWRLPGRALALGLPLTLLITAVAAHYLAGLGWVESLLVGAVLAPTDPVFASALVGNDKVPPRLRQLLNVESGVNDGLALPLVMIFLGIVSDTHPLEPGKLALELAVGVAIGVAVPWLAIQAEKRLFPTSTTYGSLNALAIGMVVLALCEVAHGNLFLGAFAAGVTVSTIGDRQRESFEEFGELIAEVFKLAALLVFGALVTPGLLAGAGWRGWLFAVLVLVIARPPAIGVAFLRSGLPVRQQAAAAWFGPKGFASVVYGLIVLHSGIPEDGEVFRLVAITIVLSILLHSSTDVPVARWLNEHGKTPPAEGGDAHDGDAHDGGDHDAGDTLGAPRSGRA